MSRAPINDDSPTATKEHIRGSSLLLTGRGVALGLNFVVQVLTVRYLSKADYGAFAYALVLLSLATSLSACGLDKAVSRFVSIYRERQDSARVLGTAILATGFALFVGVLLASLVYGLSGQYSGLLQVDSTALDLLLILALIIPIEALDRVLAGLTSALIGAKAIFVRRYLAGPGLKLLAVVTTMVLGGSVTMLAVGYAAAACVGVAIYLAAVWRAVGFAQFAQAGRLRIPIREVLQFALPLFASDVLWLFRGAIAVLLLEYFHATTGVAAFRAVVPVAGLIKVVFDSFQVLYTANAARLFARADGVGMNSLYWQTAAWITLLTFPVFLLCFSLAEPLTIALFGQRYADSASILSILSLGYYVNIALGFNALTLTVYGKVKRVMLIDLTSGGTLVALCMLLIPLYGALGAALATAGTLIFHNILNQTLLLSLGDIELFPRRHLVLYGTVAAVAGGLWGIQTTFDPPLVVGIAFAALASLAVWRFNRGVIDVGDVFPEVARLRLLRRLARA
jgi:O-antigen/teichoic acid export membrane protein